MHIVLLTLKRGLIGFLNARYCCPLPVKFSASLRAFPGPYPDSWWHPGTGWGRTRSAVLRVPACGNCTSKQSPLGNSLADSNKHKVWKGDYDFPARRATASTKNLFLGTLQYSQLYTFTNRCTGEESNTAIAIKFCTLSIYQYHSTQSMNGR